MTTSKFPELGFYGLPGHTRTPRDVLRQVTDAEMLGVGNVMISERADYKEIAAICGACAAVTEEIFIGTSATNINTRHPMITASIGSTLNRLSEGRFALGLAKGSNLRWRAMGLDHPTYAREAEFLEILRRLWRGETVQHDGALGRFPHISVAAYLDEDIPVLYVGFGPNSLVHAGRIYDGVHLHTFMGPRALASSVARVREGEAQAGRDSGTAKVWSVLATACDVSDEVYLKYIVARLASYLQIPGYGEMLVAVNEWDPQVLTDFRQSQAVKDVGGFIDSVATSAQLERIMPLLPDEWRSAAAVGDARTCAERWVREFEAGADGIIIHASTPEEFAPVLAEYEKIRPATLFAERTNRPA